MNRSNRVSLDVVIPIYNEQDVLPEMLNRLSTVFHPQAMETAGVSSVRCILVDDGSTDRSAAIICEHIRHGAAAKCLRFSRNFGHQNAVSAGIDASSADLVAVMDADLQDPPEMILEMVAKWREGADVVFAQRRKRKENPFKRLGCWAFYRLLAFLSEINIPLDSGDFCLMDRRVVDAVVKLPERLRFPRGLRAWVGFRQVGLEYDRPPRRAGVTKYRLRNLYRLATDGIASSSIRPLKAAQLFSFCFAVLAFILICLLGGEMMRRSEDRIVMLFLANYLLMAVGNLVVMISLFILGAYVGRTYLEVKGRPSYVVMETIEPEADPKPAGS